MHAVLRAAFAAASIAAATLQAPSQWRVTDPGQGPVPLESGVPGPRELSGLAWAGGARYYAVGDKGGMLYPLTVDLDARTGTVTHAAVDPGVHLPGSEDLEGVVYEAPRASVLVSDEVGPAIREYRVADGGLVRSIPLPPIYREVRRNLSLESLSADPEHTTLWTANEETLTVDGPPSTMSAGSVVRLQRFDASEHPSGQWAYRTDAIPGDVRREGRDIESSGVSDLVALPGGGLIVLERAFGAVGFRMRLYEVDFTGASDVSAVPSLGAAHFAPVAKRLLWERTLPDFNFEGAALGPPLGDGRWSLILIADDGHGFREGVYALILQRAS